jgi:hypothetical protein
MNNEAERFAYLVTQLRGLLERYMEHTEDSNEHPLAHMALLQVFVSLEFLHKYSSGDPNAAVLLKEMMKQYNERLANMPKH